MPVHHQILMTVRALAEDLTTPRSRKKSNQKETVANLYGGELSGICFRNRRPHEDVCLQK